MEMQGKGKEKGQEENENEKKWKGVEASKREAPSKMRPPIGDK